MNCSSPSSLYHIKLLSTAGKIHKHLAPGALALREHYKVVTTTTNPRLREPVIGTLIDSFQSFLCTVESVVVEC